MIFESNIVKDHERQAFHDVLSRNLGDFLMAEVVSPVVFHHKDIHQRVEANFHVAWMPLFQPLIAFLVGHCR